MVTCLVRRRNPWIHLVNRVPAVGVTSWRKKGLSHPVLSPDGIRTSGQSGEGHSKSGGPVGTGQLLFLLSRQRVS